MEKIISARLRAQSRVRDGVPHPQRALRRWRQLNGTGAAHRCRHRRCSPRLVVDQAPRATRHVGRAARGVDRRPRSQRPRSFDTSELLTMNTLSLSTEIL